MYESVFSRGNYRCGCGAEHCRATAEVVIKERGIVEIGRVLGGILSGGHVGIIFMQDVEFVARRVQKEVETVGYRVTKCVFAPKTAPNSAAIQDALTLAEDIRVFISVGGGAAADIAGVAAKERGAKLICFTTSPTTTSYFFSSAEFYENGERNILERACPTAVIADLDVLSGAPRSLVAAGYGALFSKLVAAFDNTFAGKTYSRGFCRYLQDEATAVILDFFAKNGDVTASNFIENLTSTLFAVGVLEQMSGEPDFLRGAECVFASALSAYTGGALLEGENAFLCSHLTSLYYSRALHFDGGDLLPPQDKVQSIKRLSKLTGMPLYKNINALAETTAPEYLKTSFMLDEYREDLSLLVNELAALLPKVSKTFRRIYDDAGYFLKNFISSKQLLAIMSLSAATYDKYCYLNYLKDGGALERLIE